MTERNGSGPADKAIEENTSVFTPAAERGAKVAHEATQVDRPGPTPPWQRGQQAAVEGVSDGRADGRDGRDGRADGRADGRPDGHGQATVVADQPTVAEQRPPYPPPMSGGGTGVGATSGAVGGSPNGSASSQMPVPNPFANRADPSQQPLAQHGSPQGAAPPHPGQPPAQQPHHGPGGPGGLGVPPRMQPGASVPLGGPGGAGPGGRMPGPVRSTARPATPLRGRVARAPRKASLQIRRFDPWSVFKLSLVLSVATFLMWLVAVGVLYGVLDGMGVWDKLNGAYSDLASVNDATGGGAPLISASRVFGVSAVVGVVNIVLFTAFATVGAFVYNVSADLAGGIEVTLSERD